MTLRKPKVIWFAAFTAVFAVFAAFVFWGTWSTSMAPVMPAIRMLIRADTPRQVNRSASSVPR